MLVGNKGHRHVGDGVVLTKYLTFPDDRSRATFAQVASLLVAH